MLILDDVWSAEQARAFHVLDSRSNALITTRIRAVVQSLNIQEVLVESLSYEEARQLLWEGTKTPEPNLPLSAGTKTPEPNLPPEADVIIKEAGRLPLALSLCAG